ncbi:transcription factor bHLH157-like isoform X2 [Malania oleifera]|uniref:transcription factor bHLH157-like isoform X2 n=1 Tax=Malania oleifera TaxID=397392 RepID=UPI0025AE4814|nr:transcription factor bHLH157-like isoform X2 [Malania oleifera]
MGTTALRHLLKSLCDNSHWTYAVFWKLKNQTEMILTWEDGYHDYPKRGEFIEIVSDELFNNGNEMHSTNYERSARDRNSSGYPVGLTLADMTCLQYTLGEGLVGGVAYSGSHCWVLYDGTFSEEFSSKFFSKYPNEWLLQFAAGIKTILLVPVVPHGVVQLGSLEMVAEDLALVGYIKESFNAIQAQPPSSQMSVMVGSLDKLSDTTTSLLNGMQCEDMKVADGIKQTANEFSTKNLVAPLFIRQDVQSENAPEIIGSPRKNNFDVLSVSFTEVSTLLNQFINASESEVMGSSMFKLSCLEEEFHAFSECSNYNLAMFGESSTENLNFYYGGDMMEESYGSKVAGEACYRKESLVFGEDACSSSSLINNKDLDKGIKPLALESSEWFTERGDGKHLLEAVVANINGGSDGATSNRVNKIWPSTSLLGQFANSQPNSQSEGGSLMGDDYVPESQVTSAFVASGRNPSSNSSISASSFKSMVSTLIDEEPQKKRHGLAQSKKLYNVKKIKAKTGASHKPRPRDRQMIQDRVKELRELVPNGAKCSIDCLLDQTIKHMMFLRSVTVQAEKLRQWTSEETASQKWKSSAVGDGCKNGTSWAFELGSDFEACPIVVEDLKYPGYLLIEMLCNEHGLFLEIAQVIRSLQLTILKGVMESRLNNKWAHFIVEVSRGFHRMDVFWPLMSLLQRKPKSISSKM